MVCGFEFHAIDRWNKTDYAENDALLLVATKMEGSKELM